MWRGMLVALFASVLGGCQTVATKPVQVEIMSASEWRQSTSAPQVEDALLSPSDAASFLRRTGFEPSPGEVMAASQLTRHQLIQQTLQGLSTRPVVSPPDWVSDDPRYWLRGLMDEEFRQAFNNARAAEVGQLRQWWVQQMIQTPSPMAERLVLFFDNRLVAGFSGLNDNRHALWQHHQLIRDHATGDYRGLIQGLVRDPAVLMYLDNDRNTKDAPNENLAREIMELYVLGEGNYTEADVKQAARALTGYGFTDLGGTRFQLQGWNIAGGSKSILGQRGQFDGDDLPRILLDQRAAAEHLVRGLWYEFVSTQAPAPAVIDQWTDAAIALDYRIDHLLDVILYSPEFWDPAHLGYGVKSPVEFVVGAVRATQSAHLSPVALVSAIQGQGQNLFDPPDVSGYAGGVNWLAPEFLVERQAFARSFAQGWMTKTPEQNFDTPLYLLLGGEAYFGPPAYEVTVVGEHGRWTGSASELEHARDTERLGRYQDDSEIEWARIPIQLPSHISAGEATALEVRFMFDAAGSTGDRNLFVGGAQWRGQSFAANLGTQTPGCRGNSENTRRNPGKLYCAGTWRLDLQAVKSQADQVFKTPQPVSGDLNTRGFYVRWANAPDDRYRSMNVILDGLEFEGREWEIFSFKYAIDDRGTYKIDFTGDECIPDCFTRWPAKAWRDEVGRPHVNVPYSSADQWAYDQYNGLTKDDKRLVKALMGAIVDLPLTSRTFERDPAVLAFWTETQAKFIEKSQSRRWRLSPQPKVRVLGDARQMAMMSMGGMMNSMQMDYQVAAGEVSIQQWLDQAEPLGPAWQWGLAVQADASNYPEVLQHPGYYLR